MDLVVDQLNKSPIEYNPPRFWWTKRIIIGSGVLMVLVVGMVVGATTVSQRRLDALIESYRAAGEPVYAEDFNVVKEIPEEENAATFYRQAEQAYVWPIGIDPALGLRELSEKVLAGRYEDYREDIEKLLLANDSTLYMLMDGSKCEYADWQFRLTNPIHISVFPDTNAERELGWLLSIAIVDRFEKGLHDEVLSLLHCMVRLGKHRMAGPGSLVTQLTGVSIAGKAPHCIERFGNQLNIWVEDGIMPDGFTSREHIEALILELIDDKPWHEAMEQAFFAERAFMIETGQLLSRGQSVQGNALPGSKLFNRAIRPLAFLNIVKAAEFETGLIESVGASTYPSFWQQVPSGKNIVDGGLNDFMPANLLLPSFSRFAQLNYYFKAERCMAAIALAIRLFEAEHGELPDSLNELVPVYLDSIPNDPFHVAAYPIKYDLSEKSPRLYSLGRNLIDDGGVSALTKGGQIDRDNLDLVFYLRGDGPSSTE